MNYSSTRLNNWAKLAANYICQGLRHTDVINNQRAYTMDLKQISQRILAEIPQQLIPTDQDGQLIRQYKTFFQKHEDGFIQGFYDLVTSDAATQHFIQPGERSQRENTLKQWYRITTNGHFDEAYWGWQTLVGMVHVKHQIPNTAFLSMWGWMINYLQQQIFNELPLNEALPLVQSLQKIQTTASCLVVESYVFTQQDAIGRASGLNKNLLKRFIDIEIDQIIKQGRALLQAQMLMQKVA